MKRTLIDLTQNILSALNADEVNSISDTAESMQVAEIIRTTYYNIATRAGLPNHEQLFQLDSSTDSDMPVLMYKPDHVKSIRWLKYFDSDVDGDNANNTDTFIHDLNLDLVASTSPQTPAPSYKDVTIYPIKDFLEMVNKYNVNEDNVESFTFTDNTIPFGGFTINFRDDQQPTACAVIQNYYVIFNAYDAVVDSTLQSSKTQCFGEISPVFSLVDTFIPDLDDEQFPLLLNEAKSLAYVELLKSPHPKAEQEAKRQWSSLQKDKSVINRPSYFDQLNYYGRK